MSILSELGKFLSEKFKIVNTNIQGNKTKISSLESEISILKSQIEALQTTGSRHLTDIDILDPTKGLVLRDEYYLRHRIRINNENKLIVDNIDTNETHEIQLYPSGSSSIPITWDG